MSFVGWILAGWSITIYAQEVVYPLTIEVAQKPYGRGCLLESTIIPSNSTDLASVTVSGYWSNDRGVNVAPFSAFFADLDQGGRRTVTSIAMVNCHDLFRLEPRGQCRKRDGGFLSCLVRPDVKRSR